MAGNKKMFMRSKSAKIGELGADEVIGIGKEASNKGGGLVLTNLQETLNRAAEDPFLWQQFMTLVKNKDKDVQSTLGDSTYFKLTYSKQIYKMIKSCFLFFYHHGSLFYFFRCTRIKYVFW